MRTAIYADSVDESVGDAMFTVWPTYSERNLNQYFERIRLPSKYLQRPIFKSKSVNGASDAEALNALTCLIRYHLTSIPFENLDLHYSSRHSVFLNHDHVFQKIVRRECGRGGHCMESTFLFVTILKSLGYDVQATGARVNPALQPNDRPPATPSYDNWNHMVGIVRVGQQRYLIDMGFGNNSLTYPVPLEDGYSGTNGRPSTELRLRQEQILDNNRRDLIPQLLWTYSVRFTTNDEALWIPGYCFGETEFMPQDFEEMSYTVGRNPRSWFTQHVVCLKFLMDEKTEQIVGDIALLDQEVRQRKNGVAKVLDNTQSERERIEALQKYLDIRLSEIEQNGITGTIAMIRNAF